MKLSNLLLSLFLATQFSVGLATITPQEFGAIEKKKEIVSTTYVFKTKRITGCRDHKGKELGEVEQFIDAANSLRNSLNGYYVGLELNIGGEVKTPYAFTEPEYSGSTSLSAQVDLIREDIVNLAIALYGKPVWAFIAGVFGGLILVSIAYGVHAMVSVVNSDWASLGFYTWLCLYGLLLAVWSWYDRRM